MGLGYYTDTIANNPWVNSWQGFSMFENGFVPNYTGNLITTRNSLYNNPYPGSVFTLPTTYGSFGTTSPYNDDFAFVGQVGSFFIDPSFLYSYNPPSDSLFGFLKNPTPKFNVATNPTVTQNNNIFGFLQATSSNRTSAELQTRGSQRRRTPSYGRATTSVSAALDLARSQIGVRENGSSNNSYAVNKYRFGKADGTPWCASFVSWCFGAGQNSNNALTFGYDTSSQDIKRQAQNAGFYASKNSSYRPKAGDLMVLRYADGSGHIGIIEKINRDGTFTVIEGNSSNSVQRVTRSMSTNNLDGFVRMNEWASQTDIA